MVARKWRIRVVLDTNVFVRHFKTTNHSSPNRVIFRLWWVARRIQLIVSSQVVEEYLEIFSRVLEMTSEQNDEWRGRFEEDSRCTVVNLGPRFLMSRDPDDNVFLATALTGQADYLIINDRDLLELADDFQRRLPFAILTPQAFIQLFRNKDK
jgi:uncharacterized protein